MLIRCILCLVLSLVSVASLSAAQASNVKPSNETREWDATGTVKDLRTNEIVISHEAIADYMPAMTMPFKVKDRAELESVSPGDKIAFRLHVTDTESWIDHVAKTGTGSVSPAPNPAGSTAASNTSPRKRHPLLDYKFTNELNQAVRLSDFHGQALAITFFFTRCPIPEYCPRLSKNFQEACRKLSALPNAPTNWHFLSVTFDPENDTPAALKGYAETYNYDSTHWSFLTGPTNEISELARLSDLKFQRDGALFNHDFRTQIIDAAGRLQMVFPVGGDLSDAIVRELLKAAAPTNPPASGSAAASK